MLLFNTVTPCSNSEDIVYIENMHEQPRVSLFFSEAGKNLCWFPGRVWSDLSKRTKDILERQPVSWGKEWWSGILCSSSGIMCGFRGCAMTRYVIWVRIPCDFKSSWIGPCSWSVYAINMGFDKHAVGVENFVILISQFLFLFFSVWVTVVLTIICQVTHTAWCEINSDKAVLPLHGIQHFWPSLDAAILIMLVIVLFTFAFSTLCNQ